MSKRPAPILALVAFTLIGAGYLVLADHAVASDPIVEDSTPAVDDREQGVALQLRCRVFTALLGDDSILDTADATTEIGQWIAEQAGWQLHSVDFEIGQKATGFPQGYRHVCLSPTE